MSYSKYFVYKKQYSNDGGAHWYDVVPAETTPSGDSIGTYNTLEECERGTPTFGVKWRAVYQNSYAESAECDSTSAITEGEIYLPNLVYVEIGNCVTSIGDSAFYKCSGLTNISIADSVTSIGHYAFSDCYGLTSVYIPSSVNYIGKSNDSAAVSHRCGDDAFVGPGCFANCKNLTSIIVDGSNTVYDSRNNCNGVIKTSDNELICGCKNTVIPNSVTKINQGAFRRCTTLTSINIPNSVTSIDHAAFYGCTGLTSCTIGTGVTRIEDYTFSDCYSLQRIVIPNNIELIEKRAFACCSSLTGVRIGKECFFFESDDVFIGCENLESIIVNVNNTYLDSRNNCNGIIKTTDNKLILGCKNTVIPNSVTSIGYAAFRDCTGLTSINIPSGVTSIGIQAFRYCSGLTSVTIPNSVRSIGNNAFADCSSLTSVTIGSGVTSIDTSAFEYCSSLRTITITAAIPPTLGSSVFSQTNLRSIYVPRNSYNRYKNYPGWKDYSSIINVI